MAQIPQLPLPCLNIFIIYMTCCLTSRSPRPRLQNQPPSLSKHCTMPVTWPLQHARHSMNVVKIPTWTTSTSSWTPSRPTSASPAQPKHLSNPLTPLSSPLAPNAPRHPPQKLLPNYALHMPEPVSTSHWFKKHATNQSSWT